MLKKDNIFPTSIDMIPWVLWGGAGMHYGDVSTGKDACLSQAQPATTIIPPPRGKRQTPPSQFTWKDDHNDKGVLEVIFLLFHDPHFGIGIELAGTPGFQKWSGKRLVQASEEPMTYLLRTLMSCIQEQLSNTVHWPVSEQGGPTCPPPKAMVIGFSHPPHDFLHHCSKPDQAKL